MKTTDGLAMSNMNESTTWSAAWNHALRQREQQFQKLCAGLAELLDEDQ